MLNGLHEAPDRSDHRHTARGIAMVLALVLLVPALAPAAQAAPSSCGGLASGEELLRGEGANACDGGFSLQHQDDGNVVLYTANGTALWATGTDGAATTTLVMQTDGNLVLYDGSEALWSTDTYNSPGATLAVQADGNLVVYAGAGVPLWASGTVATSDEPLTNPADVDLTGTDGPDFIVGTGGEDRLDGGAGEDQLIGRGNDEGRDEGADILRGGPGDDVLDVCGGEGTDFVVDNEGRDIAIIDGDRDMIFGFTEGEDIALSCADATELVTYAFTRDLAPGVATLSLNPDFTTGLDNDALTTLPDGTPLVDVAPGSGARSDTLAQQLNGLPDKLTVGNYLLDGDGQPVPEVQQLQASDFGRYIGCGLLIAASLCGNITESDNPGRLPKNVGPRTGDVTEEIRKQREDEETGDDPPVEEPFENRGNDWIVPIWRFVPNPFQQRAGADTFDGSFGIEQFGFTDLPPIPTTVG